MNTQAIIYEELKIGRKLSIKSIQKLLGVSPQHAWLLFNKVAKLDQVEVIYVEEQKDGRHFLRKYLRYKTI